MAKEVHDMAGQTLLLHQAHVGTAASKKIHHVLYREKHNMTDIPVEGKQNKHCLYSFGFMIVLVKR